MMRRASKWNKQKQPDPNAPPPPVDPRTPPPQPKEMVVALADLRALLPGVLVAPGFGFGDMSLPDRTSAWRLYAFVGDGVELPPSVGGFDVVRRPAHKVPEAWGRKAK